MNSLTSLNFNSVTKVVFLFQKVFLNPENISIVRPGKFKWRKNCQMLPEFISLRTSIKDTVLYAFS